MSRSAKAVLWTTLAIMLLIASVSQFVSSQWIPLLDNLHWTLSSAASTILVWIGYRNGNLEEKIPRRWFLFGIASYFFGQLLWNVQQYVHWSFFPAPADVFYLLLGPCCLIGLLSVLNAKLTGAKKTAAWIDLSTISISVIGLVLALYLSNENSRHLPQMLAVISYPIGLLSAASVALLINVFLRLTPCWPNYIFFLALLVEGSIWMQWNVHMPGTQIDHGQLLKNMFSVGDVLIGLSAMGWRAVVSESPRQIAISRFILRIIPVASMFISVITIAIIFFSALVPIAKFVALISALMIIVLAMMRQSLLLVDSERLLDADRLIYEANIRYEYLANHDVLTGLPNRRLFQDRLVHAIAMANRHRSELALLFIDIDRFKNVNDSLGHIQGDMLLVELAGRLKGRLREEDTFARIGGDEFVVLIENIESKNQAAVVAQSIIELLETPFTLKNNHQVVVGASIGISLFPYDAENDVQLIRNADSAMYRAKESGRNNHQFYTLELTQIAHARFKLDTQLRQAIENKQFVLFYQPIVEYDKNSGRAKVVAVEALIRWYRNGSELVMPNDFIPFAEDTGLIVPIGKWVLEQACRQLVAWDAQAMSSINLAVNISPKQFHDANLLEAIESALRDSGLAPNRLTLEITEGAIMEQEDQAVEILLALKALGLRIAIDDFGTGHSSLSKLRFLPLDELKIDRAFVQNIPDNLDDMHIASTILTMAKGLRLHVVAEGIETEEQLAFFAGIGCEQYQGYKFSRPIPATDLPALVQSF